MADIKNSKLSAAPSPIPSSKSPLPPLDSEGNPVVDPDADMEDDPDVITKVYLTCSSLDKIIIVLLIVDNNNTTF